MLACYDKKVWSYAHSTWSYILQFAAYIHNMLSIWDIKVLRIDMFAKNKVGSNLYQYQVFGFPIIYELYNTLTGGQEFQHDPNLEMQFDVITRKSMTHTYLELKNKQEEKIFSTQHFCCCRASDPGCIYVPHGHVSQYMRCHCTHLSRSMARQLNILFLLLMNIKLLLHFCIFPPCLSMHKTQLYLPQEQHYEAFAITMACHEYIQGHSLLLPIFNYLMLWQKQRGSWDLPKFILQA